MVINEDLYEKHIYIYKRNSHEIIKFQSSFDILLQAQE